MQYANCIYENMLNVTQTITITKLSRKRKIPKLSHKYTHTHKQRHSYNRIWISIFGKTTNGKESQLQKSKTLFMFPQKKSEIK